MAFSSGGVYEGEWTHGFPEGVGVFKTGTGVWLKAEFKEGQVDGKGLVVFSEDFSEELVRQELGAGSEGFVQQEVSSVIEKASDGDTTLDTYRSGKELGIVLESIILGDGGASNHNLEVGGGGVVGDLGGAGDLFDVEMVRLEDFLVVKEKQFVWFRGEFERGIISGKLRGLIFRL